MSDAGSEPFPFDAGDGAARRDAPATARNREAIAAVLATILPDSGTVLEIASGTGQHALFFARRFPALSWQPTDPDPQALASIAAWRGQGTANLLPPLALDAAAPDWRVGSADAMLCVNMVHISPWAATCGLFAGAGRILAPEQMLAIYGPFIEAEVETASSNLAFDRSLRARDRAWGLRDAADLDALAARHGLHRAKRAAMPANNLMLIYRRN